MKIKICGIRTEADLHAACDAGADAVGFLVGRRHVSPHFISLQMVSHLLRFLTPFVTPVLVTHLSEADDIFSLYRATGISTIQLHGDSPLDETAVLRNALPSSARLIYAIHPARRPDSASLTGFAPLVDAFLLDSEDPATGRVGGTGMVHDWAYSSALVRSLPRPVILAGGLNPENVASAIRQVRPYGVDVNSSLKNSSGAVDPVLCSRFVQSVYSAL